MDFAVAYQEASVLPPLPPFSIDSPLSAADFFLIDPDLSLSEANEQSLIAAAAQHQYSGKGDDALASLYRLYCRFQRSAKAEATALVIAKLRFERGVESPEWTLREIRHFAATHKVCDVGLFDRTMREILKDRRLSTRQYWTFYKEIAAICYTSLYSEEAVKLSIVPPESMSDYDYTQWCSIHNQLLQMFPNSKSVRHSAVSDSLLWTLFQAQRTRSGVNDAAKTCLFRYFEYHIEEKPNPLIYKMSIVKANFAAALAALKGVADAHVADMLGEVLRDGVPWHALSSLITFLQDAITVCKRAKTKRNVFEAYLDLYQRSMRLLLRNLEREEYFLKLALVFQEPSLSLLIQTLNKLVNLYRYWRRSCYEVVLVRVHRKLITMAPRSNLIYIRQLYKVDLSR